MFGSLMMFASGVVAMLAELGQVVGLALGRRRGWSGKLARMRPASEMSRVVTLQSAAFANACTIGSSE